MKQLLSAVTLTLGVTASLFATSANAAGTFAGTVIENTATVSFGPSDNRTVSTPPASVSFTVDEVINVNVTSLDSGNNVDVNAGDTSSVQAYQITNLGNGNEAYDLQSSAAGDFTPESTRIYYELVTPGSTAQFDGTEDVYTSGSGLNLDPDQEYYIYLVSNIPASATVGQTSTLTFDAVSQTPGASSAAIGGILTGEGTNGTDVIVATANGTSNDITTFSVTAAPAAVVTINKSILYVNAVVNGQAVAGQYIPGATVKYLIAVEVTSGTADNLEIIDSLPADVTYVANSLVQQINGAGGFVTVDPANGGYDSVNHKVSVSFGNRGAGTYDIQLDALIK